MAFEIQQFLTSGRLQKSDFTLSHSACESSVSDAVMSSFSIVPQDISPHTSRFSAYSNDSSPHKFKRRRSRRSSKAEAAVNLLEDANKCNPLALETLASLSSNWLNLSFADRTPTFRWIILLLSWQLSTRIYKLDQPSARPSPRPYKPTRSPPDTCDTKMIPLHSAVRGTMMGRLT
ncbi:hypothetical protein DEU56DRAFT_786078 [Suillus clintonianus]|uniref:uncharacterized protein n=1 Tax=Suillus clintonianus TaxID=1904413 RepID=UPI001B88492C|nr:uncharacterized protein DEU56DRAFT_786078 [Suillus clintonianus]KAG2146723.1 hypothetical protein DEU56DRAFT_786078 [Suillus clintonianus]